MGSFGSWISAKGGCLGIRFSIDGEIHYGWARLSAMYSPQSKGIVALLTSYAYETQPNAAIRAGDKGQSDATSQTTPVSDPGKSSLGAWALGATAPSHRCGQ